MLNETFSVIFKHCGREKKGGRNESRILCKKKFVLHCCNFLGCPLRHTIRKVKFLSKNSILTKPQHFHEFFIQIFFKQFFSWNQSCQQLKSPKPQHFHEFFTPKIRQFSREIKVEFLDKKWRFRTVWSKSNRLIEVN